MPHKNYFHDKKSNISSTIIILSILLFSTIKTTAQPSSWTVIQSNYTYTESMVVTIEEVNNNVIDPNGSIAAFDANGVCRGVANFNQLSVGLRAFLTVYGNLPEEDIYFRVYDAQADEVYLSCATVSQFQAEATTGSLSEPIVVVYDETKVFTSGQAPDSSLCEEEQGAEVSIKVFLQGPYQNGEMNAVLQSLMPLNQPFSSEYNGMESVTAIPVDIVDWVLVELRNPVATVLATRAAFLKKDGTVVDLDGLSPVLFEGMDAGDYFIAVKHRNHLSIMTSNTVRLEERL